MVPWFKRSKTDGKKHPSHPVPSCQWKEKEVGGKGGIFTCVTQLSVSLRTPGLLHSYVSVYGRKQGKEGINDTWCKGLSDSHVPLSNTPWQMGSAIYTTCASLPRVCFWVLRSTSGGTPEGPDHGVPGHALHLVILRAISHLTFISWFWPLSLTTLSF